MSGFKNKILLGLCFSSLTTAVFAISSPTGVNYNIINGTSGDITVFYDKSSYPLDNAFPKCENNCTKTIYTFPPEWVDSYTNNDNLNSAREKTVASGKTYRMERVEYGWNHWSGFETYVSFKIKNNNSAMPTRTCNLKFHIDSKNPVKNRYVDVKKLSGTFEEGNACKVDIAIDKSAIDNCNAFWCSNVPDKDYATVNITIIPHRVQDEKLVIKDPECVNIQEENYRKIYVKPSSKFGRDIPIEEPHSPARYLPICAGGTLKINLPDHFAYSKMEFHFKKMIKANNPNATYDITHSINMNGLPVLEHVNNGKGCDFDTNTLRCRIDIKAEGPSINTGEKSYFMIKNYGPDALWPTFDAWSLIPEPTNQ